AAVVVRQLEEALEVFFLRHPAADGEEVDDLDEETGVPFTGVVDYIDHFLQAVEEAVVADAQQRPAGDVTNAGGFHHQDTGLRASVPLIPFEHLRGDETVFGRPPGHHGRHPGARLHPQLADVNGGKP